MYFPRLAERVRFLKEDEEGVVAMSDYFEEREKKAVEKAQKKSQESMAIRALKLGKLTLEEIAECTGLTLKGVQALEAAL